MIILAAQTSPWPIVLAAVIGSAGALGGVLAKDFTPSGKRRWDDELFAASSRFLSEMRLATLLAVELDPSRPASAGRLTHASREDGLLELRLHQNLARELERQIFLLAGASLQEPARLMVRHLYSVIEVIAYGEPDRRADEFNHVPPLDRLKEMSRVFVIEARKALRVRDFAKIYLVSD